MIRIATAGYLGNQLFQWAFGHYLVDGTDASFSMQLMSMPTNGWGNYLDFLIPHCEHMHITQPRKVDNVRDKLVGKGEQIITNKFKFKGQHKVVDFISRLAREQSHANRLIPKYKNRLYYGYFQNVQYFTSVISSISDEFASALEKIYVEQTLQNPEYLRMAKLIGENEERTLDFQLVHVRRGDFLLSANSGFGLLSPSWYQRNIDSNLPIVIITDDMQGSRDVIEVLKPTFVINPELLTPLETLTLFGRATTILCSNSTFSFWGGLYALHSRKKSVIAPDSFRPDKVGLERLQLKGIDYREAIFY